MNWMAWTTVTIVFFSVIGILLVCMTVLELIMPSYERKGILPIETTRGDRFFISLLGSAYIHLIFLAFSEMSLWIALCLSLLWAGIILRWG